jgi:hypothetical protein
VSIPGWILAIFAAVMLLAAEVSAGQLAVMRAWTRGGGTGADIAVSDLLTAIAMAGILLPGLSILPNAAWEVVFAVMTAWFVWRLWRLWRERGGRGAAAVAHGPDAPYLVRGAAMLYVFAALAGPSVAGSGMSMSGPGGMSGMAGGSSGGMPTLHASTLALIFALLLVAFTVHDLDRRADVDGYFRVAGHRFMPGGSTLAAAAAGPVTPRQPAHAYTAERLLVSPGVVKGFRVATGVTMAFILITMI